MVELDGSKLQKEVSREKVLEIHWSRYLIPRVACVHLQTLRNGMLIDRGNLGEAGIDLFHTDFLQFLILPPHSIFICLSIYLPICARLPAKSFQSCPTLCDPMDCSPSGSSVHGILQARILEWVAISFSRGSS